MDPHLIRRLRKHLIDNIDGPLLAVQRRASTSGWSSRTSLMTGPWSDSRTVSTTSSPPLTLMTSSITLKSRHSPMYSYWLGLSGLMRSM